MKRVKIDHPDAKEIFINAIHDNQVIAYPTDTIYGLGTACLLYTSPSPRDAHESRMPSSA